MPAVELWTVVCYVSPLPNTHCLWSVDVLVGDQFKPYSRPVKRLFHQRQWTVDFQLQFLIWISPLRGPKTFPTQKLSPSILVRVTQSIQKVSQTAFLIMKFHLISTVRGYFIVISWKFSTKQKIENTTMSKVNKWNTALLLMYLFSFLLTPFLFFFNAFPAYLWFFFPPGETPGETPGEVQWNGVARYIGRSGQVSRVYHANYLTRLMTTRRIIK